MCVCCGLLQLCAAVLCGCPVRECHLMCMEALSTPGRLCDTSAYYVIGQLLPHGTLNDGDMML